MGKIILNETQYSRIKNILIENAINKSLLNEQTDNFSYTVKSEKVAFENAVDPGLPELMIYKGAKFVPDNKGNIIAKTSFNFADTLSGDIAYSPESDLGFVDSDKDIKRYTYQDNVIYVCGKGKFKAPSKSKFEYFAEDSPAPELVKELNKLCQKAKSQKSSYGAESVGGGKSYSQKFNYVLKSDKGTNLTIPKGTGYSFKEGKNGASFRLPGNKFGWFGCLSKVFQVDGVKYKDEKGALAGNISKAICGSTKPSKEEPLTPNFGGGGTNTSGSKGGGSSTALPPDIDLYI
jgi:hypothetical protein